jgi:NTP pyrophosphatase (non-canonical NTP hydrolase)
MSDFVHSYTSESVHICVDIYIESKQNIKEEMADILIYLVQLADKMEIDLEKEVFNKLEKNAVKYPVNKNEVTKK